MALSSTKESSKSHQGTLFPHLKQGKQKVQRISTKQELKSTLSKESPQWAYIKDVVTANFKGKHGPPVFKATRSQKVTHKVKPP